MPNIRPRDELLGIATLSPTYNHHYQMQRPHRFLFDNLLPVGARIRIHYTHAYPCQAEATETRPMPNVPEKTQQILLAHAGLIHRVVQACQNRDRSPELDEILRQAEQNEWFDLVSAIRKVLKGERSLTAFRNLDEEDLTIIEAILRGLQNPQTLPDMNAEFDANLAAPGLASLIHASRRGDAQALHIVANMAHQMLQAGGDMARVAGQIRPLVLGERDPNKLCEGLGEKAEKLVQDILAELKKLETH